MSSKTVEKMMEWLDKRINTNPTKPELSSFAGYSEYCCSARFNDVKIMSYGQYRAGINCCSFDEFRRVKDNNILNVTLDTGFLSHESFYQAYAKEHGCPPDKQKKKHVMQ